MHEENLSALNNIASEMRQMTSTMNAFMGILMTNQQQQQQQQHHQTRPVRGASSASNSSFLSPQFQAIAPYRNPSPDNDYEFM